MKKLNLGCGDDIKREYVNLDKKDFDFNVFPYPLKDNTFSFVYMRNVLEHLTDIEKVMNEIWRISREDAMIEIIVPYWNHSSAYNSPEHMHYFNTRTFENICKSGKFELLIVSRIAGRIKSKLPMFVLNFLDKFLHSIFIEINTKIRVVKPKKESAGE